MTSVALGPGGEFDRIRAIAAALGADAVGLGDDCAVVPSGEGAVVLSTDVSVEGVHFRREWISPEEIGWRAAAAALSDLAAAGAACSGVLAAVAVPPNVAERDLVALMRGIGAAAREAGGAVLGGDLSRAPVWCITVTVVGRARRPMGRAGARPRDTLWVTGALGGARSAVDAWVAGRAPGAAGRAAFAHPVPRIAAGQWLAAHGATAMLDLSDGIGADARHLAAASDVHLDIDLDQVPLAPGAADATGGEDYELLAALPPGFSGDDAARCVIECGVALTRVGVVSAGAGVSFQRNGAPVALGGFDHFPPA